MEHKFYVEERKRLEPGRVQYAVEQLTKRGFEIHYQDHNTVQFWYKDNIITIYPYTGWYTGKGVKNGRGIQNLLNELK